MIASSPLFTDCKSAAFRFDGSNPSSPTNTCGLNDCNPKTARVSSGFPVFIPKIIARFSWMQNTYLMDSNDRSKHLRAGFADFSAEPALFLRFQEKFSKNILHKLLQSLLCTFAVQKTEVIPIAILFSQVKVQSADQSETFLISGIPKEYDDLTASVQLEWFLQDIDSDETVQVHGMILLSYCLGESCPKSCTEAHHIFHEIRN